MTYKIAGIENRGTKDDPFGFIYLARKNELAGRIGFGSHAENPDPLAIWACRETPTDLRLVDGDLARDALAKAFPHLAKKG